MEKELKKVLLEKYAKVIVKVGANVQENQVVCLRTQVACIDLAREIVKACYQAKAKYVMVQFSDDLINREYYLNASDEVICDVFDHVVKQHEYLMNENACLISISSPTPHVYEGIDPMKFKNASIASNKKLGFFRNYTMSNQGQWVVVSYPTQAWADEVFKDDENAFDKLLDAILKASRVSIDNDPVKEWEEHIKRLDFHNKILNEYNFKTLKFKNSLGTDLSVDLVENHIWGGGGEKAQNGVWFAPNIPTEETFTMPHSHGVNGRVYSTKPLNYNGSLIEDFYLDFKDGCVVNYHASKCEDALKALLETDDGAKRLGEVALISHDSPISNMNILFYNTLFDENASCHLALGNAYTMNIKDGYVLSEEELIKRGYNKSIVHVDFMFGSHDMSVVGVCHDGKLVEIFKDGNFVF